MLGEGTEVQLALLSESESVELLASVAALEDVPPVLLQISKLCGRLPVISLYMCYYCHL